MRPHGIIRRVSHRRARKQRAGELADRTLEEVRSWTRDRLVGLADGSWRSTLLDDDGHEYDVVVEGYPEAQPEGHIRVVVAVNHVGSLISAMSPQSRSEILRIPD
jgi:hypothetical protein